mgnify:CR=1 FL=1
MSKNVHYTWIKITVISDSNLKITCPLNFELLQLLKMDVANPLPVPNVGKALFCSGRKWVFSILLHP